MSDVRRTSNYEHRSNTTSKQQAAANSLPLILDMPHHKKPRLDGPAADAAVSAAVAHSPAAMANELSGDIIAIIFGCFPPEDIMRMRHVCKKWREAAKTTIVPMADFSVDSVRKYNAMRAMTTALPHLQQLQISHLGAAHKYSDGEDPADELWATATANFMTHDINIISSFRKLRTLNIQGKGTAGLPSLKELDLHGNANLTGNLRSLRVLKDTLEKVEIVNCPDVEGSFMDLADFPHLTELDLFDASAVTGDVREICEHEFPVLERLCLPKGVYGCDGQEFRSISDAHDTISFLYSFRKQRPPSLLCDWYGELSMDSPDWYDRDPGADDNPAPMYVIFVEAGSRVGYRWETAHGIPVACERYEGDVNIYRGYHQPPTEDECDRLWAEYEGALDLERDSGHCFPISGANRSPKDRAGDFGYEFQIISDVRA
eukprot:scaffold24446_cov97-Skeletonema_dohrnii-CCMP3373.AAC.3